MHVVFGATCYRPSGAGTSTYVRGLLDEITPSRRGDMTVVVQADAASLVPAGYRTESVAISSGVRRALINKFTKPVHGGLFHGLDVDLPLRWAGPTVATVHDLAVFDVPWTMSAFRARGEQLLLRHAAQRADVLIAVSDFTAERLQRVLRRDAIVIPNAAGHDMRPPSANEAKVRGAQFNLPERFVLHVGTVEPRKNVARLAAACLDLDIPLVLAGEDWQGGTLPGQVIRLGYVARADLPALYAAATATAYVSMYEGFGLPPVEAMACGAAVVCSPVGSLRPLLGEDAARWVEPTRVSDIAAGLRAVVNDNDVRRALVDHGRTAAAALSFAKTAARTAEVWKSLS